MTTFINGRFLTQKTSGVQRFAREIVKALDRQLSSYGYEEDWVLLLPEGTEVDLSFSVIKTNHSGNLSGHVWEQTQLFAASRRGRLINLCNSGPILHGKSLTVIHDAMIFRTPENFSRSYRAVHRSLGYILARRGQIATVSNFSRRELEQTIGAKNVTVIRNSCEHMTTIAPDQSVLQRLELTSQNYILFVGSPTPNKNILRAIEAVGTLGEAAPTFVIVGAAASTVFKADEKARATAPITEHKNILFTGRLSDEDIVSLYQNATALLFPSLYEGFGIPPLEAMILGCPVLSSNIDPVREVCSDAALYFDPLNPHEMASSITKLMTNPTLRTDMISRGHTRALEFSWDKGAAALVEAVSRL